MKNSRAAYGSTDFTESIEPPEGKEASGIAVIFELSIFIISILHFKHGKTTKNCLGLPLPKLQ